MLVPNVKKIAVLRANGLGDFIFALPAIQNLRQAYPEAEIVLLGLPWHASFLTGRPSLPIDRVVVVPVCKGVRDGEGLREDEGELERFFLTMELEKFDMAIQIHGGGRHSNPFILKLGAKLTAGSRTPDAAPLDRSIPYIYWQPEKLRYLEVMSLVGAHPLALEPKLALTEADIASSNFIFPPEEQPFVVIHPAVSDGRRRWPPERFAAVGDRLADNGALVILTGMATEQEIVGKVMESMSTVPVNLCGSLPLGGLAGLFSRASLVVANDSGPLHLARAVGTRTVGIYWCGNFITAGTSNLGSNRCLLSWRLECPTCGENCIYSYCDHHDSFVAEVTVKEVASAALDLLAQDQQYPNHNRSRPELI